MNVSLAPELEQLIDEKVTRGHYGTADEVIREALRLLDKWERLQAAGLAELKGEIQRGLEQLDRGEAAPLDIGAIKLKARAMRG